MEKLIGLMEINEAKRIQEGLFEKGIKIDLRHNPETCKKGCSVKIEVWTEETDIPEVVNYIEQRNMEAITNEGVEVDLSRLDSVYDPEQKETVCPACGTSFSTDLKECPECGLVFMVETGS